MNTHEGGSLTVHTRAEIERNVFSEVKLRRGNLISVYLVQMYIGGAYEESKTA